MIEAHPDSIGNLARAGQRTVIDIPTTSLGGLRIAVLNRKETAHLMVERCLARRNAGGGCDYHTAANGQVIAEWRGNEILTAAFTTADVISVDSTPMIFASRLFGSLPLPERVATSDLFFDVAERAQMLGLSFYLLGGDERTNERACSRLSALYPALSIVGRRNGFFGRDEEPAVVAEINAAAPDILWVGMGVPRQEEFALQNRAKLTNVGVLKTCGGCFRYLSGELRRAPDWIQQAGFEWVYLACLDPRNRLMRYVRTNPLAIYRVVRDSSLRLSSG